MNNIKRIVGIDLGTTNSCISVLLGTEAIPKVIENDAGDFTTPTVVAFLKDEKTPLIGRDAVRQAFKNPKGTFFGVKRLMGQKHKDIKHWSDSLPYEVVEAENGEAIIKHQNKTYHPSEILAHVLIYLMKQAKKYVETTKAVITVPAHFNEAQRQAVKDAAAIAEIDLQRIISEPTAAALAYGIEKSNLTGNILVYDLGGGTFDVTLMSVEEQLFHVIQTGGDTFIGGENFDLAIVNRLKSNFKKEHGIDLVDETATVRLFEEAKKAKENLSFKHSIDVHIPFISLDKNNNTLNVEDTISRSWFNTAIEEDLNKTIKVLDGVMDRAQMKYSDVKCIILVGGSVRINRVKELIEKHTNLPVKLDANPDTAVCIGAGIQGGIISGDVTDIAFVDATPLDFGIETADGIFVTLIPSGTSIPTKKSKVFTTAHHNQTNASINIGQGARKFMKDNKQLGSFELKDIKQAPKGSPKIEVTFEIDADNTLKVSATEGKAEAKIELKADSGLTKEQIEKIKMEAADMKDHDEKKEKCVIANHQIEENKKSIEDMIEKLPKEEKEKYSMKLSEIVLNVGKYIQDHNIDKLNEVQENMKKIMTEIQKISQDNTNNNESQNTSNNQQDPQNNENDKKDPKDDENNN